MYVCNNNYMNMSKTYCRVDREQNRPISIYMCVYRSDDPNQCLCSSGNVPHFGKAFADVAHEQRCEKTYNPNCGHITLSFHGPHPLS